MRIYWLGMSPRNWIWIDIYTGQYWYVFIWRRWKFPFIYRSLDATPPWNNNDGRMIFGSYKD